MARENGRFLDGVIDVDYNGTSAVATRKNKVKRMDHENDPTCFQKRK